MKGRNKVLDELHVQTSAFSFNLDSSFLFFSGVKTQFYHLLIYFKNIPSGLFILIKPFFFFAKICFKPKHVIFWDMEQQEIIKNLPLGSGTVGMEQPRPHFLSPRTEKSLFTCFPTNLQPLTTPNLTVVVQQKC